MKYMIEALEEIKSRAAFWRERAAVTKDVYKKDIYSANQRECEVIIKIIELAMTRSMFTGEGNEPENRS